jgi:hypothetical protein
MGLTRCVAWRCRYRIGVPQASAGAWVLLGGVDASIVKTATIVDAAAAGGDLEAYICRPLRFDNAAVVKVSAPAVVVSHSAVARARHEQTKLLLLGGSLSYLAAYAWPGRCASLTPHPLSRRCVGVCADCD